MIEPADGPTDEPVDELSDGPADEPVDELSDGPADEPARRSQTMFSLGKIATAVVIALGVGVGIGGAVWRNRDVFFDPPTVDITFSLECQAIEGKIGAHVSVPSWSEDSINYQIEKGTFDRYEDAARLAFDRGVVNIEQSRSQPVSERRGGQHSPAMQCATDGHQAGTIYFRVSGSGLQVQTFTATCVLNVK